MEKKFTRKEKKKEVWCTAVLLPDVALCKDLRKKSGWCSKKKERKREKVKSSDFFLKKRAKKKDIKSLL